LGDNTAPPVTLLYFADTRFPIERANGVQTMATCHALAARGHDVTLVTRPDTTSPPRDPFRFYGLAPLDTLRFASVSAAPGGRAGRVRFLLSAMRRSGGRPAPIVVTRDLGLADFLLQRPAGRRPPVVYESHGVTAVVSRELPALLGKPELAPSARKLHRLDRRERRVWRRASACVTLTRLLADDLAARHGHREKVFVVPDGAHPAVAAASPPVRPDAGPAPPAPVVAAYAGHLYPWKGVDVFVRSLVHAPDVRGLIVGGHPGESDLARITSLAGDLGVRDRITITGLLPPGDVAARLAGASMLVLPNTASAISARYTSPLKLFEYLALGRPIVASDLPSIREVLEHGASAWLVPPGDPEALGAALVRLAGDAALSARLAAGASALMPRYSWDARAARLERVLEAAAG
jgi:glycosyltransferase involved in cell wall biosynthesis